MGLVLTTSSVAVSSVGGVLLYLLGGWDVLLQGLLIFMAVDIITGLMKCFYRQSEKTESGCFSSTVFFNRLLSKGAGLLIVIVAVQADIILSSQFIDISLLGLTDSVRNAVIIFFCMGELISIIENVGQMGVPIPSPIRKALDVFYDGKDEHC